MYGGFSKDNGNVIGKVGGGNVEVDLSDTQDTIGAEESLIGVDQNGDTIALVAQLHPASGELQWTPSYDLNYVKRRTVAMSQMTSMLRDADRNRVYELAIQRVIDWYMKTYNANPVVLDIGCGSGLLSLLSVKYGAQHVFGVEMFDEMAEIATDNIAMNNAGDRVIIVNAKSSDIAELPCPVDIIVSELLDSALLGEGCIPSHADAIQRFLKRDDISDVVTEDGGMEGSQQLDVSVQNRVIPNRAVVYATCVESNELHAMTSLSGLKAGNENFTPYRNEYATQCKGGWPTLPIHWDMLQSRGAKKLSGAVPCLYIDFCSPLIDTDAATFDTTVQIQEAGIIHGIMLWWKTFLLSTELDPTGQLHYTTEPGAQNWQDHWTQTIFPLPSPIICQAGDVIKLHVSHDSVSIWVSAVKVKEPVGPVMNKAGLKRSREETVIQTLKCVVPRKAYEEMDMVESCSCGWHLLYGSDRMLMMHDYTYNTKWDTALSNVLQSLALTRPKDSPIIALDLSDGSLFSMALALKAKRQGNHQNLKIVSREKKMFSSLLFSQLVAVNHVDSNVMIWDGEDFYAIAEFLYDAQHPQQSTAITAIANDDTEEEEVMRSDEEVAMIEQYAQDMKLDVLISDCAYFQLNALSVWQALSFHYQITSLAQRLTANSLILPSRACVMIMPMELPNLRNCHGLIDNVCGFDHAALDARQDDWHIHLYPYRLSNYRKRALASPQTVTMMNFHQPIQSFQNITQFTIEKAGSCDGFAIWVDYVLDSNDNMLQYWNGLDFPAFMTQSIKFLPASECVTAGNQCIVQSCFEVGQSDVQFSFAFSK